MTELLDAATERVTSLDPFVVRRTVRWSECDPANVVYLGNYTDYLLSAIYLFRRHLLKSEHTGPSDSRSYHTPGKAMSLVFQGPLWPGDMFDMTVHVTNIGNRTWDLFVHAHRCDDSSNIFIGRLTSIFVSAGDRRQTVLVPDDVRKISEDYRSRNPAPPDLVAQVSR